MIREKEAKAEVAAGTVTPAAIEREDDAVLSASTAARLLGVSRWTLYAAANRGDVPHRRIGRRMLFSRRALLLWLGGADPRDAGKRQHHASLP